MPLTGDRKREYDRLWRQDRRARIIQILGGQCTKCGSTQNLEVDHINPADKNPAIKSGTQVSTWTYQFPVSWAWSRIETELIKCQLLCRLHHQEKTRLEQSSEFAHGTAAGYHARKCRCDLCREWMKLSKREYRARKRNGV